MARKRAPADPSATGHRVEGIAAKYSIGVSTVRKLIATGQLEASKFGDSPRSPVVVTDEAMVKGVSRIIVLSAH